MKTLKELAVDHPYYSSESNYYSNDASQEFETMTDFLDEFEDADIDMNLVFRWDVFETDEEERVDTDRGEYYAMVFIICQRKGIYMPCEIGSIKEDEVERFVKYLIKHNQRLQEMWQPLNK